MYPSDGQPPPYPHNTYSYHDQTQQPNQALAPGWPPGYQPGPSGQPPPPHMHDTPQQLNYTSNPEWYGPIPPIPPPGPSHAGFAIPPQYPPQPPQQHQPSTYPPPPLPGRQQHLGSPTHSISPQLQESDHAKGPPKKKRKARDESTASLDAVSVPMPGSGGPNSITNGEKEKRTKTGRACDACRTKKIRCDILTTPDENDDAQPLCAHCKQYNLECTFFLPITETRFKKKKAAAEDGIGGDRGSESHLPAMPADRDVAVRTEGPTSINFLLQTSLPASASEAYNIREHNAWEVIDDGDGLIKVSAPPTREANYADGGPDDPTVTHNRLNKPVLSAQTMSLLVNAYFDHIAPLFPVVNKADFISKSNPSPLLLYAICGLGATRRQFPREVFAGVRGVVNGLLRSNDILSDARFENVQALLLLGQVGDLHAQPTAATASASLIRMATATRMAQDLGLHRESNLRAQTAQDLAFVELRRRVWASCVIFDRWYGAALGIPLLVDLLDCDVLLPAPYEIIPGVEPEAWPMEPSYLALSEHLKLSILIGRCLKTIYSPTGLKYTTDAQLQSLLEDMTAWQDELPEVLKYRGPDSILQSGECRWTLRIAVRLIVTGLLHMAYTALQFLFWRVFMRIQYNCPSHITFRLHVNHWNAMVKWSGESIVWLSHNDQALDTLFIFPYTATSCALIQYHTWARRRSPEALEMLKVIKDTAVNWEKIVQPDQMSIRRKTCETMTLLYEAALKTNPEVEEPKDRPAHVNPTPGVSPRTSVGKAIWVQDSSRDGGGIWVARNEEDRVSSGLPPDCCLLESDLTPDGHLANELAAAKDLAANDIMPKPQPTMASYEHQSDGDAIIGDLQATQNVNPQMNANEGNPVALNSPPPMQEDFLSSNFLDSLPVSGFDFPSWEQYFQAINSTANGEVFNGLG